MQCQGVQEAASVSSVLLSGHKRKPRALGGELMSSQLVAVGVLIAQIQLTFMNMIQGRMTVRMKPCYMAPRVYSYNLPSNHIREHD